MDLDEILRFVEEGQYEFSFHAQQQRLEEDVDVIELEDAIVHRGEILESYPDDPRGESCLVLGFTVTRPIHAVVGRVRKSDEGHILRIIPVYIPQPPKWVDARTRGERS